jgi:Uma2 family endonuclease
MPAAKPQVRYEDMGELLKRLGNISPKRVCMNPLPGTATERDLIRMYGARRALYELVEGTLVEKGMGHKGSAVAVELVRLLANFVTEHDLGYCTGADDLVRVLPRLVRGPDVAFVSWITRPDRVVPPEQIGTKVPDLVVEVLGPSNTRKEMRIKLKEYFLGGVKLVWLIDPETRTAEAHTAPDRVTAVGADGALDGSTVLPGFSLPLATLFARFGPPEKKQRRKKTK